MKILTLVNEKGGVGKTTLSVHIAAGLAVQGKRVVLIDADAQGQSTISLGLKEEPGLYDLLVRDADFERVLRVPDPISFAPSGQTVPGALYVLPSNVETRLIADAVGDNVWLFQERIAELEGQIDVVVIDTSPTPSLLHGLIYMASDSLLYPTELENLSMDGLSKSIQHRLKANQYRVQMNRSELQIIGIQPTMKRKADVHDYNLKELLERFKRLVWPAIPQRTVWSEASEARRTVWAYDPRSKAVGEAWALIERVQAGAAL